MGLSILADQFRAKIAKSKDLKMEEGKIDVGHPTGFLNFDFLNGCTTYGKRPGLEQRLKYYSVGVTDGSMIIVMGRSGCGKTTFIIQSAANITKDFKTSCIFHDDVEGGSTDARRKVLTQFNDQTLQDRYIYRNSGITIENFYERIKVIHDIKIENREQYEYDTGMYDPYGNRIYKMEPTVYILDSLAMIMPEKNLDEDELSGQMSQTATARAIAGTFRRVIPMLKTANIILFVVNHITTKIQGIVKTKSDLSYLKPDETLPGGRNPIYLSNTMIRMDDTKLKETDALNIKGAIIEATLCKTRSSSSGRKTKLVLEYDTGFDPELSMFVTLKDAGWVNGSGAYLYLKDRSDIKFAQRNFKTLLRENEEFANIFQEVTMEYLQSIITDSEEIKETISSSSILDSSSILAQMNNLDLVA